MRLQLNSKEDIFLPHLDLNHGPLEPKANALSMNHADPLIGIEGLKDHSILFPIMSIFLGETFVALSSIEKSSKKKIQFH